MTTLNKRINKWLEKYKQKIIWKYRLATWQSRTLPDFIIIGAQKAGTSSLFYYLSQHPQILPSYKKEVHFFDGGTKPESNNYAEGIKWYQAHFPIKKLMKSGQKTFEASPLYMFNPLVAERIFKLLPRVKLIVLLRNPTKRAISHYFHEQRHRKETLPIYEALQQEELRLSLPLSKQDYKHNDFIKHSYKSRGLYKKQLENYFKIFPKGQILIIKSENFFENPNEILNRVFEFVGVDTSFKVNDLSPRNVAKSKTDAPSDVYEYLRNYFKPHNEALYELIGENYDW
jgi:hypothetical protein